AQAAAAYGAYLAWFPSSKSRLEMEQNHADALAESDQPLAAARAYERVAALLSDDKSTGSGSGSGSGASKGKEQGKGGSADAEEAPEKDALASRRQVRLNAIASYQQALERGNLTRIARAEAWGGIRAQGRALIAERPDDESVVKVKLSVARTYYDAGDYG